MIFILHGHRRRDTSAEPMVYAYRSDRYVYRYTYMEYNNILYKYIYIVKISRYGGWAGGRGDCRVVVNDDLISVVAETILERTGDRGERKKTGIGKTKIG